MLENAKRIALIAVASVALTGALATARAAYGAAEESGPTTAASKDGGEAGSSFALAGGDGGANVVVAATDRDR